MKPAAFAYHRPRTVEDAIAALASAGEDAKIIAGGQSLVPMMSLRLAQPAALVDLNHVAGLDELAIDDRGVTIGALVRHHQLATMAATDPTTQALVEAAGHIGHLPIRTRGTFGGSLAHADSTAEWCVMALALDARLTAAGPDGEREIPVDDFFTGPYETALTEHEVLVSARLARMDGAALAERAPRHGDFATVVVGVGIDLEGTRIARARIALGGVASTVVRARGAEDELTGARATNRAASRAGARATGEVEPPADQTASAAQRRRLVGALVTEAVERAVARARQTRTGAAA